MQSITYFLTLRFLALTKHYARHITCTISTGRPKIVNHVAHLHLRKDRPGRGGEAQPAAEVGLHSVHTGLIRQQARWTKNPLQQQAMGKTRHSRGLHTTTFLRAFITSWGLPKARPLAGPVFSHNDKVRDITPKTGHAQGVLGWIKFQEVLL